MMTSQHSGDYSQRHGYLSKGNLLSIPNSTLIMHSGGLTTHVGRSKIVEHLKTRFFWPRLQRDIYNFIERCSMCQSYKGIAQTPIYMHHSPFLIRFGKI